MAPSAGSHIGRIIAAKSSRAVVAGCTIIPRTFMFLCLDSRDLTSLQRPGSDRVTIGTIQSLCTAVLAMTEHCTENISAGRCSAIGRDLVADVARADLALRSVTGVASRVSLDPDRKSLTGPGRFMTRRTALRRKSLARDVRGVHELHVETFLEFCREFAQRWLDRLHIIVADRTHRLLLGVCELADVATDTRVVTGEI